VSYNKFSQTEKDRRNRCTTNIQNKQSVMHINWEIKEKLQLLLEGILSWEVGKKVTAIV